MTLFQIVVVLLLAGLSLVAVVLLHKIRRVHISTFRMQELIEETHRETKALFAQIQALGGLERLLKLEKPLPPMRHWAGSPDFLLRLAQELLDGRKTTVLECSSGVSTVVAARCMQLSGAGHVYSLEHDERFAGETRLLLKQHGLEDWATVIHAPLRTEGVGTPWYSLEGLPASLPPVDVLVVDGPPASLARLARYPALPQLKARLAPSAAIFMDDADRQAEREIIAMWQQEMPTLTGKHLPYEKGLVILRQGAR